MTKFLAVLMAFGLVGLATPAFGFCHGCGRRAAYYAPAPVTTYYAPAATTAYYAPTTTYYAPATTAYYAPAPTTTYYAPAATTAYYAPTTTYYAPTTTYYAPTTAYYAPTTAYYAPAVVPTMAYYAPAVVPAAAYYPGVLGRRTRRALRWGAPVVVPYQSLAEQQASRDEVDNETSEHAARADSDGMLRLMVQFACQPPARTLMSAMTTPCSSLPLARRRAITRRYEIGTAGIRLNRSVWPSAG